MMMMLLMMMMIMMITIIIIIIIIMVLLWPTSDPVQGSYEPFNQLSRKTKKLQKFMNLATLNVRGISSDSKKESIFEECVKRNLLLLGIQETKHQNKVIIQREN